MSTESAMIWIGRILIGISLIPLIASIWFDSLTDTALILGFTGLLLAKEDAQP